MPQMMPPMYWLCAVRGWTMVGVAAGAPALVAGGCRPRPPLPQLLTATRDGVADAGGEARPGGERRRRELGVAHLDGDLLDRHAEPLRRHDRHHGISAGADVGG